MFRMRRPFHFPQDDVLLRAMTSRRQEIDALCERLEAEGRTAYVKRVEVLYFNLLDAYLTLKTEADHRAEQAGRFVVETY